MKIDLTKQYDIQSLMSVKLEKISQSDVYKFNIHGRDIFIKSDPNVLYAELIAAELLDILGIPRVENTIGLIHDDMYFISYANYNNEKEFISGNAFLKEFYDDNKQFMEDNVDFYGTPKTNDTVLATISHDNLNSLHTIWGALEWYIAKNNIKNASVTDLLDSLIDQFVFICINHISDFHGQNWALLHQGDNLSIYPKFDNDYLSAYFKNEEGPPLASTMGTYIDDEYECMDGRLTNFLIQSEPLYMQKVSGMVEKVSVIGIKEILNRVEKKWGIKIPSKRTFISNFGKRIKNVESLLADIEQNIKKR